MDSHKFRTLIGLLAASIFLISCQADRTATSVAEVNPAQGSSASANEGSEVGESNPVQRSEAGEPQPEPRTELSATNPGRVNLGSGRVTLVEFFAYW